MAKKFWDVSKASLEDDNGTLILRNEAGESVIITPGGSIKGQFLTMIGVGGTAEPWTNMPAALTEFLGNTFTRVQISLAGMSQFRFNVGVAVAGAAGSVLGVQYSTGGLFFGLDDGELNLSVDNQISIDTIGSFQGSWHNLFSDATDDVTLRILGQGGDAVADPAIVLFMIQFR